MNTFIAIAWRNIWRNRRRSALTLTMIGFGLFLCIFLEAIVSGTQEQIFKGAIELNLGSLQIHAKDYQENQTLAEAFAITPALENLLKSEPLVQTWTPRIMGGGMVSVGENTNIAVIVGIDPEKEAQISTFQQKIMKPQKLAEKYPRLYPQPPPENRYLSAQAQQEILIGDKLAEKLEAKIGDQLAAMVQGADGSTGSELYQIVGVYHTGQGDLDNGFYMHLADADELFSMHGQVSLISVRLPLSQDIPGVLADFKQKLDPALYEVLGWNEIAPELVDIMAFKNAGNRLLMLIMMIIIAFGILNTVFMTIMERIQEFGVLKALGTSPRQIFGLVMYETLFLTLLGILVGNLSGGAISYYFLLHPIDLSSMTEMYEDMGISSLTQLPANPQTYMFVVFSLLILVFSMLAALYPAIKAARLEPLDALKHT
ncbi:hypothetical protein COW36_13225 [bacterium (Candidatus Blackallbacteria) CG17_big_fil_post_rev_8_21_14_2_50_48_46]|uniref:ABC transporter permease n=1 Tax=bacterium (Candidatus Blackallbacteria) CG17_big_fil_post_rev_8_21_14_2_50_48_46 TaxID=2014261 RepID=A0A2M7G4P9_9BACT|nr:MAG: hypothetical protein COW64_02045 [bacterium (Candidatus Blackallbacteria) CG18_big_fil_WC_8_21_14_2_50_49_26]PIW16721.1 MAG: hypothetical protein COW36_13225 [bacterium (Candidatus Blackallbacteria) CG17_big_fil_post_rev_8_21_14_2_50_48_46]PIW46227.1 MAG: hypothetical protein COW20_18475 [bacterium (Candidatus Blackallbacteria) CG13_big_fil_rev_8_21_14_2_50_49_14]